MSLGEIKLFVKVKEQSLEDVECSIADLYIERLKLERVAFVERLKLDHKKAESEILKVQKSESEISESEVRMGNYYYPQS